MALKIWKMKIPAQAANTSWIICLLLCCRMYLFVVFIVYFLTLMEYPVVSFAFCCLDLCIFVIFSLSQFCMDSSFFTSLYIIYNVFIAFYRLDSCISLSYSLVFLWVCIEYIFVSFSFFVITYVCYCLLQSLFSKFEWVAYF